MELLNCGLLASSDVLRHIGYMTRVYGHSHRMNIYRSFIQVERIGKCFLLT